MPTVSPVRVPPVPVVVAASWGPPAVARGPGWRGLRAASLPTPYHEALLAAGIAVLVFDYRGFGDSEGDATFLDPATYGMDPLRRVLLQGAGLPREVVGQLGLTVSGHPVSGWLELGILLAFGVVLLGIAVASFRVRD